MKSVEVVCKQCGCIFKKSKSEYKRQVKNGRNYFFCNRKCAGKHNAKNFGSPLDNGTYKNLVPSNKRDSLTPFREHFRRIKRRKHLIDVSLTDLKEVWKSQNGKCALTGVDLVLEDKISNPIYSASLDRINSTQGYIKNNIQWIGVMSNYAKNKYSNEVFYEYLDVIRQTQNNGDVLDSTVY